MTEGNRWLERIARRHPAFSPEDPEAFFKAWKHSGQIRVHEVQDAVCELCGYPRLRYQFLLAQRETGEAMWVGSECVLNFELPESTVQARLRQVRRDQTDAAQAEQDAVRYSAMLAELQPIYQQAGRVEQRRIRWMVGKSQQRGGFSPGDLGWLYLASLAAGVPLEVALFPVVLKSKQDRFELKRLSVGALRWLAPGMNVRQRELCEKLGVRMDFGD